MILHNTRQTEYRNPTGAVLAETEVQLSIIVEDAPVECVILRLWLNNAERLVPMISNGAVWSATVKTPPESALLWYYFIIETPMGRTYYGNNSKQTGGAGQLYAHEPPSFQITVYDKRFSVPDWAKAASYYQIMTDRFFNGNLRKRINKKPSTEKDIIIHKSINEPVALAKDSEGVLLKNDFYGGNLKGITKKLQYLKEYGITALYLNPIFEAFSNHKYDTADYNTIDPMFGDEDDLRELCAEAAALGIRIIIDGVFSHTGADSVYFNKYGRYNSIGAYQSPDSPYYSWYTFREYPHDYVCWWGCKTLPNTNELNPSFRAMIMSAVKKWLDCGVSGWRLDVADELPMEFLRELRDTVREEKPDALIIGEVWEDASRKVTYGELRDYFMGDTLDGVMNYPFRNAILLFVKEEAAAADFAETIQNISENYPPEALAASLVSLSTHDTPRILYEVGSINKALMAITLQFALPGSPTIFYGDEVGLNGAGDPFNRAPHPFKVLDKAINAHYKKMAALRSEYTALLKGSCDITFYKDNVVLIQRTLSETGEQILIAVNRAKRQAPRVKLPIPSGAKVELLFSSGNVGVDMGKDIMMKLPPASITIAKVTTNAC